MSITGAADDGGWGEAGSMRLSGGHGENPFNFHTGLRILILFCSVVVVDFG